MVYNLDTNKEREVKKMTIEERVNRMNEYGYRCIHIFKNLYLVRHHGKSTKFSLYGFMIFRDRD